MNAGGREAAVFRSGLSRCGERADVIDDMAPRDGTRKRAQMSPLSAVIAAGMAHLAQLSSVNSRMMIQNFE
jgi:hypothetical protein